MEKESASQGFTVVELLVAMAISGVLMAGVYSSYYSQQKASKVQNQVAAMQQNIRAAIYFMTTEIRMAGYDPVGGSGSGLMTANSDKIRITMDITDNSGTGDPDGQPDDANEDVTYELYDADGDGISDLGRDVGDGSGYQLLAPNIDALNFIYLKEDGNTTTTASEVRSVQITLVARTDQIDQGYTNSESYANQQGTVIYTAPGDNYRRRLLTAQVKCRNIGLI